jgi:hypothetical protein
VATGLGISGGEGWVQIGELGLAFGLSALIGLERESGRRPRACGRIPWSASPPR